MQIRKTRAVRGKRLLLLLAAALAGGTLRAEIVVLGTRRPPFPPT